VFKDNHIDGETIIADNSTDKTPEIAKSLGAKVIVPDEMNMAMETHIGSDSRKVFYNP